MALIAASTRTISACIAPNDLSTEEDVAVAVASIRQARMIATQPALARYRPVEWRLGAEFQTDAELADLAGQIATTILHPVGTTRMGRADDDAGIMPTINSGNTNAPTLAIAEKAARWVAREMRTA